MSYEKTLYKGDHTKTMSLLLLSVIGLDLLSLSIIVTMASAQTPPPSSSNSTVGSNSTTSNQTSVKQMTYE
ncbi:MAG TPA: hypothetical protein VJ729_08700 [Nitrososphaeraceae archaeon]|nr:hypothetical protein [Nitrososphaeraceae archaeon]